MKIHTYKMVDTEGKWLDWEGLDLPYSGVPGQCSMQAATELYTLQCLGIVSHLRPIYCILWCRFESHIVWKNVFNMEMKKYPFKILENKVEISNSLWGMEYKLENLLGAGGFASEVLWQILQLRGGFPSLRLPHKLHTLRDDVLPRPHPDTMWGNDHL